MINGLLKRTNLQLDYNLIEFVLFILPGIRTMVKLTRTFLHLIIVLHNQSVQYKFVIM